MDPEHDRLATALLARAARMPEVERRSMLDRECAGNPTLRAVVARLIAAQEATGELPVLPTVVPHAPFVPAPSPASLRAGQRFGDFRLERLLGTGGFAQVWEAEDHDGRRVALKVLNQVSPSRQAIKRFEREGRLAASLNHTRSVYVFGAFEIEGHATIAMELVSAGSLEDRLRDRGALPAKEAVDRILEILEGLEAAHRLGIVHRDVKPSNCFLDADGRAKVGDFGISRSLELDTRLTATGSFLGTPAYASPEQIRGENLDARSDLYSVGATLYALLSGQAPFAAQNAGMLFSKILTERPRPLSACGVRVPRGLERAVQRLLEKDPGKRYADCAAARAALVPFSSFGLTLAGIAGRPGAYFLDSGLIGGLFLLIYLAAGRSVAELTRNPTLGSTSLGLLLGIAWFTAFEWKWAGTPFKLLLGLRVMGSDGQRASFRSVLVRNVAFGIGMSSFDIFTSALNVGLLSRAFLQPLGVAVVSCTMRASNGFAGIHELASGTRVMQGRKPATYRQPEPAVGPRPIAGSPDLGIVDERRGPYRLGSRIVSCESGELFQGRDEALGRLVWILDRPARRTAHWEVNRPGRLRRLLRGEQNGLTWEAFEGPGGVSLRRRVAARGTLAWDEMSRLLIGLVEELREGHDRGDLPELISLDHLWADASGQLRLLDFALRDHEVGEASEPIASADWGLFLHQLLLLGLEGRLVRLDELDGQLPRLPLPERARELVARVCNRKGEPPSLDWVRQQIRAGVTKPAHVTRRQRGMALAASVVPVLLIGLVVALVASGNQLTWKLAQGFLYGVGGAMVVGALPAVGMTFVFRGGPWMQSQGIAVQTADGQRASRLRCLLRGLIVYAPPFLVAVLSVILIVVAIERGHGLHPSDATQGQLYTETVYLIGWWIGAIRTWELAQSLPFIGALYIAGAAQALVQPERGFADRIARTRLVPR